MLAQMRQRESVRCTGAATKVHLRSSGSMRCWYRCQIHGSTSHDRMAEADAFFRGRHRTCVGLPTIGSVQSPLHVLDIVAV